MREGVERLILRSRRGTFPFSTKMLVSQETGIVLAPIKLQAISPEANDQRSVPNENEH
jgi:hypothetical protein